MRLKICTNYCNSSFKILSEIRWYFFAVVFCQNQWKIRSHLLEMSEFACDLTKSFSRNLQRKFLQKKNQESHFR